MPTVFLYLTGRQLAVRALPDTWAGGTQAAPPTLTSKQHRRKDGIRSDQVVSSLALLGCALPVSSLSGEASEGPILLGLGQQVLHEMEGLKPA